MTEENCLAGETKDYLYSYVGDIQYKGPTLMNDNCSIWSTSIEGAGLHIKIIKFLLSSLVVTTNNPGYNIKMHSTPQQAIKC